MQTEDQESQKKENPTADLDDLIVEAFADAGMEFKNWTKAVVKMTKAKKRKSQKLKHTEFISQKVNKEIKAVPTELKLSSKVKVIAQSCEEALLEFSQPDNDTILSALNLIGKATGWVDPDAMELKTREPVIVEIHEEGDSEAHVTPEP